MDVITQSYYDKIKTMNTKENNYNSKSFNNNLNYYLNNVAYNKGHKLEGGLDIISGLGEIGETDNNTYINSLGSNNMDLGSVPKDNIEKQRMINTTTNKYKYKYTNLTPNKDINFENDSLIKGHKMGVMNGFQNNKEPLGMFIIESKDNIEVKKSNNKKIEVVEKAPFEEVGHTSKYGYHANVYNSENGYTSVMARTTDSLHDGSRLTKKNMRGDAISGMYAGMKAIN